MKMFNKVVIFGTGLIGGSMGFALKRKGLSGQVIGLSLHRRNAELARKIGAIDRAGSSLEEAQDADLVILAAPVEAIINIAPDLAKRLKKGCLVIDVASTKEKIVSRLSRLIPDFVGCHPLAGSEKKGISNAQVDIFAGSICIITPAFNTKKTALNKAKSLWHKLGARILLMPAARHDRILAFTSHLPHAVAFSLIGSIPDKFLKISSGGLADTTRIAGSDELLWSQIFLSNRKNLLSSISSFQTKLASFKLALANKDRKRLIKTLAAARKKRGHLE